MLQFPEGIPANQWLLNGNGIRFRPAFFRWIGYERIVKLICGYTGVLLLLLSVIQMKKSKHILFFLSFAVSSALYLVVFATGNVQHDYYQILIMPTVAMYLGIGGYALLEMTRKKYAILGYIVLLFLISTSFYLSWSLVKDYFNINNPRMVLVGSIVDKTIPEDAKVIALYQGDTTFLYHTNRQGWASFQNTLPEMIKKGANYLVQLDPTDDDIQMYTKDYSITASGSGYILVQLQ